MGTEMTIVFFCPFLSISDMREECGGRQIMWGIEEQQWCLFFLLFFFPWVRHQPEAEKQIYLSCKFCLGSSWGKQMGLETVGGVWHSGWGYGQWVWTFFCKSGLLFFYGVGGKFKTFCFFAKVRNQSLSTDHDSADYLWKRKHRKLNPAPGILPNFSSIPVPRSFN